jgi:hypothetical protein
VVSGHPWSGKDPLAFGGENAGFAEQSGIGRNIARPIELFSEAGNTGRKIHREFS